MKQKRSFTCVHREKRLGVARVRVNIQAKDKAPAWT